MSVWTERGSELPMLQARAAYEVGWLAGCFFCCRRLARSLYVLMLLPSGPELRLIHSTIGH